MVVSGFAGLPRLGALFLFFDWPANNGSGGRKGAWLQTLNEVAPITAADGKEPRAAAIAFTWSGLETLGLSKDALETFSAPFREGMYQEDRLRRLGDKVEDKWQGTVIKGGPQWSGNIPVRKEELGSASELSAGEAAAEERQVITPETVHALLLLYDKDEDAVRTWARRSRTARTSQRQSRSTAAARAPAR